MTPFNGTRFHREVLYRLVLRFRGEESTFERLERLRRWEGERPESLRRRQARALTTLLRWAATRCAYYRDSLDVPDTLDPDEAFSLLPTLPILSRPELQRNGEALHVSPSPRRDTRKTTGGSTGEPVTVWKDAEAVVQERAASWLGFGWFGVDIGDRGARFWSSPRGVSSRRLRFAAADLAMRRIRFSAFAFDDEDPRAVLEAMPAYPAPVLLKGDGEAMLAEFGAAETLDTTTLASRLPADWDTIRAHTGDGIDLDVHSSTHRFMPALSDAELVDEVVQSRRTLNQETGIRARLLAYPCGHSVRSRRSVCEVGYAAALGIQHNGGRHDLWCLNRLNIPSSISTRAFKAWTTGFNLRAAAQ